MRRRSPVVALLIAAPLALACTTENPAFSLGTTAATEPETGAATSATSAATTATTTATTTAGATTPDESLSQGTDPGSTSCDADGCTTDAPATSTTGEPATTAADATTGPESSSGGDTDPFQACAFCLGANCQPEAAACGMSFDCAFLVDCVESCHGCQACVDECKAKAADAQDEYAAVAQCRATQCGPDCSDPAHPCAGPIEACFADPACSAMSQCVATGCGGGCQPDAPECVACCEAEHPAGAELYQARAACFAAQC